MLCNVQIFKVVCLKTNLFPFYMYLHRVSGSGCRNQKPKCPKAHVFPNKKLIENNLLLKILQLINLVTVVCLLVAVKN